MKTLQKGLALLSAIASIMIFNSCQKETLNTLNKNVSVSQIENAKREIEKKIRTTGYEEKFEIHKRLQSVFTDMQGNIVSSPISQNLVSVCGGNFPNYNDVGSYTRAFICGQGYQLSVEWLVSWDNNIVNQHPTNPANKTTCTFRVSIPGNANAYNNVVSGTSNVVITDLGADPNYPGSNIYSVKATATTYLNPSIVNTSGAVLRLGANFVADCPALEQISISPTSVVGLGWDVPLSSGACDRNDKAWFQPPGSIGYRQIAVYGYDPLGVCPSYTAGVAPTHQMIQYSLDNGSSWNNFSSTSSPFTPLNTSTFVTRTDYCISPQLAVGSYDIKIRYANVLSTASIYTTLPNSSNSCLTGSWGTPMWTVETFPGIVIN